MAEKLFGQVTIKVNGLTLKSMKGATLDPGGVKRTTVNGSSRVHGYTEEIMNSKLECEVVLGAGTNLGDVKDAVVTFATDVGRTWVISQAWRTDTIAINEADGKAKIVLEGVPAEELS